MADLTKTQISDLAKQIDNARIEVEEKSCECGPGWVQVESITDFDASGPDVTYKCCECGETQDDYDD